MKALNSDNVIVRNAATLNSGKSAPTRSHASVSHPRTRTTRYLSPTPKCRASGSRSSPSWLMAYSAMADLETLTSCSLSR